MADTGVSFQMQQGYNACAHRSEPQHALGELALYPDMHSQDIEKQAQKRNSVKLGLSASCGC